MKIKCFIDDRDTLLSSKKTSFEKKGGKNHFTQKYIKKIFFAPDQIL